MATRTKSAPTETRPLRIAAATAPKHRNANIRSNIVYSRTRGGWFVEVSDAETEAIIFRGRPWSTRDGAVAELQWWKSNNVE